MTWNRFLQIIEIKTKVATLATLLSAALAAEWVWGTVPWYRLALFAVAVLAADVGFSAFRSFRSTNEERSAITLVAAMGFSAFSLVLGLFLVLWTGPWLAVVCFAPLWVGLASLGAPPLRQRILGEILTGVFLGTAVWFAVFFISAEPSRWGDLWWKVPLYSLPNALLLAAFQVLRNTARQTTRRAGALGLAYPLLAYATWIAGGALGFLPWTYLAAGLLGAPLSIPFWRSLSLGLHTKDPEHIESAGVQILLVFVLLTVLAWIVGS